MIEIKKLTKQADNKLILRGVDLSIKKGETVAILGPNGAGKSTLLKVLATLIKPTSGSILVNNMDLKKNHIEIKKIMGYLPHSSLLYDHYTPLENIVFFGNIYGVKNVEQRAIALVKEVGLSFFLNEPVKNFSRGMIQRIAIARAIVHEPEILLLDEPHTGLDQGAITILNNVILSMKAKGTTTLMVTHDFKQAAEICDRIIIVKNGKIVDDFRIENQNLGFVSEKYEQLVEGVS
ncbi:ABC transporter ATP-binding protein [Bacillus sp. ISL-40]|uniref:ABC transporter ATP-binding protein n=1 Tax=unclassified Bacillus (in: firmicutes) TaxID=185979 RepID=UPI001BE67D9E|nr:MULTISPECIES: ABC transporter ATP-binding protein [unclassified Bacillus (in: firmicutes)]MBT2698276.1 ABC transporter ATP-binding protein [Bacillus sp. ISL-40]MBT2724561.1 ABC transporter ATP-binding protein [Bacillus sp. ISL-46]MBT2726579.1 ABC transporter ATP-binding protein [Bacillus sp. ISL-75]MBT2740266.1 ABC transporter ATP-binding protein [Bacillus sp. ISL-77]